MLDAPQHRSIAVEKPWGRAVAVSLARGHEVWHCSLVAGGYSSRHFHQWKWNRFHVLSGRIIVRIWEGPAHELAVLGPGDQADIAPGVLHQFEVVSSGEMVEVYWPDRHGHCDPNDIIRTSDNGRIAAAVSATHEVA